ncbi:MAG: hypothetical protein QOH12_3354 [Solirubrobacteraceae bacterium]|jgi:hypothetical protein|nr:hypothetical protein [Solirubrobacteraceae bacterium]
MIAARELLADPATAEHPRRTRPRIERLLGPLAHRYGPRKSRYIGSQKAGLGKREFPIDLTAGTVTCPAGHTVAITSRPRGLQR